MGKSLQSTELAKGKRGPKTPEGKAAALANLRPWIPGQSGNPEGKARPAGRTIIEWINEMQGWDQPALEKVLTDLKLPIVQRIAAARLLAALGKGEDFDRVCDRTNGKPSQDKTVTHQGPDGGPVESEVRHTFDHDRFADLYRSSRRGAAYGSGDAAGRNGHN